MSDRPTHQEPQRVHAFWPKSEREPNGDLLIEVSFGVPSQAVTLAVSAELAGVVGLQPHLTPAGFLP